MRRDHLFQYLCREWDEIYRYVGVTGKENFKYGIGNYVEDPVKKGKKKRDKKAIHTVSLSTHPSA